MQNQTVKIIGGGLSGCEASLQLANVGIKVHLYEMRPHQKTPAHQTNDLAELVCSNSFKGLGLTSAHGLFKKELIHMGSILLSYAFEFRAPAGESLTIDRMLFSKKVTEAIEKHPLIELKREEITHLDPEQWTIIASGPLSSDSLCQELLKFTQNQGKLAFYDSIAPVVYKDSIDFNHAYYKNRWEKGKTADFINCSLNSSQYQNFVQALQDADLVEPKPFEKQELFEGCLPIEEMARRGIETLRYGSLRPVGLKILETGEKPYAVVQLRAENQHKTLYNLVGCQTRLKWATQKEILSLIPALKNAKYARLGAMHRNTFIDSSKLLNSHLNLPNTKIYFAGQITGAEGYTEAIGTGLYTSSVLYADMHQIQNFEWPKPSCLYNLVSHLTHPNDDFQPMNLNFGLFPYPTTIRKHQRKEFIVTEALTSTKNFKLPWNSN